MLIEVMKKMLDKGFKNGDLQRVLGKSQPYVTDRMKERRPFDMDEIYKLCNALDIPLEEIPKYFPPSKQFGEGA